MKKEHDFFNMTLEKQLGISMDFDLIKVIIVLLTIVFVWVTGHWFNLYRAKVVKRKELKTQHLITAYKNLNHFVSSLINQETSKQTIDELHSALSNIQLFGSEFQIRLVIKITEIITLDNKSPDVELSNLVQNLRNDLRNELGLNQTDAKIVYLEVMPKD